MSLYAASALLSVLFGLGCLTLALLVVEGIARVLDRLSDAHHRGVDRVRRAAR